MYFFFAALGLHCCVSFSLVAASRDYSLVAVHGLLIAMAGGSDSKSICLRCGRSRFDPWVRNIPWRGKWQPTPVLLPGKAHGQRSLVGYSPWGHKESDTTKRLRFHFLFLRSPGSRHMGSSQTWDGACFLLHWQVNYYSLYHQGNYKLKIYIYRERAR